LRQLKNATRPDQFRESYFFSWLWSDYFVILLDPAYRYSVVSDRKDKTLRILARTPEVSPKLWAKIMLQLIEKNIDVSNLGHVNQLGCHYPL